jgi:hypothetical protein
VASVTNNAPAAFPLGETTVTWTVKDGIGNQATATQTVNVTDDVAPTITAPAAVVVNADNGACSASVVDLGIPETADNCHVASVTNDAPSPFPIGETLVTWTVTDDAENVETATQLVTVWMQKNRKLQLLLQRAYLRIPPALQLVFPWVHLSRLTIALES